MGLPYIATDRSLGRLALLPSRASSPESLYRALPRRDQVLQRRRGARRPEQSPPFSCRAVVPLGGMGFTSRAFSDVHRSEISILEDVVGLARGLWRHRRVVRGRRLSRRRSGALVWAGGGAGCHGGGHAFCIVRESSDARTELQIGKSLSRTVRYLTPLALC